MKNVLHESARISALRRYEILDTPPDGAFDRITAIAARLFQVPIAMVSLVDEDRIWFKSRHGLEVQQINRDEGLCASCILGEEVLAITDALQDPRCLSNPLVAGSLGLRFYGGAPLRTSDGFGLGTLCVIDFQPRSITEAEQAQLRDLAAIVVDEMELRLAARRVSAYEENARQSQKMEALSRLSGGIAHHFNNILTSSAGYLHLAMQQLPSDGAAYGFLEHVMRNNERAAQLTRDFLTFSRKKVLRSEPLRVDQLVNSVVEMLRPLLPGTIHVEVVHASDLPKVTGDASHLEQVVINLIINARDAMASGGSLSIRTGVTSLAGERWDGPKLLAPGTYVTLTVKDTGHGIAPEHLSRIFEPFFTTKEIGKGTGLGLSMAHAIVAQAGGRIEVDSEPGRGSAFTLYLPAAAEAPHMKGSLRKTILLVEDEPDLREMMCTVLERAGYRVLEAANGKEAWALYSEGGPVDLVVTDLMMPVMGGEALVEQLAASQSSVPVLVMSGYPEDKILEKSARGSYRFIKKPFGPPQLVNAVQGSFTSADEKDPL